MLLAGESPPYPTDEKVAEFWAVSSPAPGRGAVQPDASWTSADRIVAGLPNHSQVILLTRIYLESRRYDVRYVNLDLGQSYLVYSDDPVSLGTLRDREREVLLKQAAINLQRYGDLFSALTSLIYLPIFFIARQKEVVVTRFATELKAQRNDTKIKRAYRVLAAQAVNLHRQVKCLATQSSLSYKGAQEVNPPDLKSFSEGFWKELAPFEFGEDQDRNPIAGRFVHRKLDRRRGCLCPLVCSQTGK